MRSRSLRVCPAIAVIAFLVAVPTALAVTPGAQLDQVQTEVEGSVGIVPGVLIGQTFTAGKSGGLTDIVVTLANSGGASGSLHAVLTRLDGAGSPDLASVIASVDLSPGQVQPTASGTDLHFATPPSVTSGQRYAIVFSTADATGYEIFGAGSIQFYVRGEAYGSLDGGSTWMSVGGDAAFATYVLLWSADPARIAYCASGHFLDLQAGQPATDPAYADAIPAIFVQGKGLTCSRPPAGYELAGRTTNADHVAEGVYERYAPPS